MSFIENIDQHKIVFPVVPNTISFARDANPHVIPWSRDTFLESR